MFGFFEVPCRLHAGAIQATYWSVKTVGNKAAAKQN